MSSLSYKPRPQQTRTRLVQPPQRLGFTDTPPPPSNTPTPSSLCSPMPPSTINSASQNVSMQQVLLKEIEEISTMTRSLQQMMEVTDNIITSL